MKIKTRELQGDALNYAVAKCEGLNPVVFEGKAYVEVPNIPNRHLPSLWGYKRPVYSSSWAHGGPIIEREQITLEWGNGNVGARIITKNITPTLPRYSIGPTPLIAAMRCYVVSKLGDEVDVPDDLVV